MMNYFRFRSNGHVQGHCVSLYMLSAHSLQQRHYFYTLLNLFLFCAYANAQIMQETYFSAQNWTHVGANNSILIENDKLNFVQTRNNPSEYVHRPIGFALSDTKWLMEFEFSPITGTETGVANLIVSVTSSVADPIATTWEPLAMTENNMISVFYDCSFAAPPSTYYIGVMTKQGSAPYILPVTHITCPPAHTYYIRVERASANTGVLSVFTDAAHTQHQPGSPACFGINAAITNLQYLQHGVYVPAHPDRALTATIDNMRIENNKNVTQNGFNTPNVRISGAKIACEGSLAQLVAHDDAEIQAHSTKFVWENSTQNDTIRAAAGKYSLTATNIHGCSVTVEQTILGSEAIIVPVLGISGRTISVHGAQPNYTYQWQQNGKDIPKATALTYKIKANDFYRVCAKNAAGCWACSGAVWVER